MKGIAKRSKLMFALVAIFLAGVIVLAATFGINAETWVFKRANKHIYSSGQIVAAGTIYDRNGKVLAQTVDGERKYNSNSTVRRATLHAVGDLEGFISTGAHSAFRGELTGYSFLNGVYDLKRNGAGNDITLTIDADLCVTAYNALNGRKGAVGVYNYKTGEILCMVSTPTYDPYNKPTNIDSDTTGKYEAIYLNRFLSGVFTPGSTFKIVTAISALENIPDINSRTFTCTGQYKTSTGIVKCNSVHGKLNFQQALSKSCNSTFACIAEELGNDALTKTAEQVGFNKRITIDGISVTKSYFTLKDAVSVDRGWAGIGQYQTLANPCQMLTMMGAIANGGSAEATQERQHIELADFADAQISRRKYSEHHQRYAPKECHDPLRRGQVPRASARRKDRHSAGHGRRAPFMVCRVLRARGSPAGGRRCCRTRRRGYQCGGADS